MNVDKFSSAFMAALTGQLSEPMMMMPDIYDHAESLGMDMSGYVRGRKAEEVREALDREKRNGEYLRLRSPVAGKPQKTGKAERKARLLAAQRRAVVGK